MQCWALTVDGVTHRFDDLPVAAIARLEQDAGCSWGTIAPTVNARHFVALAAVMGKQFGFDPEQVKVGALTIVDDDLPAYWSDGVPSGGRSVDGWVASLVRRGFTPRQVRDEFTVRDLQLIAEANG